MFDKALRKNKFNKNWIASLSLRGALMMFFFSTLSFSQIKTSEVNYFRYKVNNKIKENERTEFVNSRVLNNSIYYKINNPDSVVHFQILKLLNFRVEPLSIIDTLTITGSWHITGENGNYYRYPDCGEIIKIESNATISWQTDIELIRTKTFGRTDYKDTGRIPFQFVCDTITLAPGETNYRWQTFATEKHCIKTFVDGVYTGDADTSCNPGTINYYGIELSRHTNSLENLQPNTTYKIMVEGTTDQGHFNIMEFTITTLE